MIAIHCKLGQIDMDGYCGRDAHPEPSDEGKIGVVLTIGNGNFQWNGEKYVMENDENYENVYYVRLSDENEDRIIEVMAHEIEWMSIYPAKGDSININEAVQDFLVKCLSCTVETRDNTGIWFVRDWEDNEWEFTEPLPAGSYRNQYGKITHRKGYVRDGRFVKCTCDSNETCSVHC